MLQKKISQGSLFGAILLIAGCCIGAGMLGLPVVSAMTGFQPSLVMFLISWLYMVTTGFLLLEINLGFKEEVSIVTMAQRTLGKVGKSIAWIFFLFLFYSIMVAYVSGSGALFTDFSKEIFSLEIPAWVGGLICTLILGLMLYLGTAAADHFNRILMIGLVLSYIALVVAGSAHVKSHLLEYKNWTLAPFVLPIMLVSFGFHNLVPTLTTYLRHDAKRLKKAILIGSLIPLAVYFVWEWLILGLVPVEGVGGFKEALQQGQTATHALNNVTGVTWVLLAAQLFAFFAIVTSFIGVALSFVDFLADGLHIKKTSIGKLCLCILVLLPAFLFSLLYPQVFLVALGYAGGIGTVILFGILPAAMAWVGRYKQKFDTSPIVPGGKGVLLLIILFSILIIALQITQEVKEVL